MPRITKKNLDTGEVFSFDWNGNRPPTDDDITRAYEQRNEAKIAALDKISSQEPGIIDRVLASKPATAVLNAAERLGLPREYHPIDSAKEMVSGLGDAINYWHPSTPKPGGPQNPQLAGAVKAARGAMGLTAPFATAAGYIYAPVPTAAAMLAGGYAGDAARYFTPENWSPETKGAIETGANVVGGTVAGILAHHFTSPRLSPGAPPPPKRAVFTDLGREQLPPGGPMPGPRPPAPPPELLNPPPPPPPPRRIAGPPQFRPPMGPPMDLSVAATPPRTGPAALEAGAPRGLLPERGMPTELPPASIAMPPAGTFEAQQAAQQRLAWGEENLAPMAQKQLPPPGYEAPAPDIVSTKQPEALSPSEVSSVSPAGGTPLPPAESGGAPVMVPPAAAGPVQAPQGLTPEVLPPVTPPAAAPPRPQSAVDIVQPQAETPLRPPLRPPAPPVAPPTPAPVPPVAPAPPVAPVPEKLPAVQAITPQVLPPETQPKAPMIAEGEKTVAETPASPGPRWNTDPGAIPGEPQHFLGDDPETSPVAIIERQHGDKSTYEVMTDKGESLGEFNTLPEAAKAGEYAADNPKKTVTKAPEPTVIDVKPEAPKQSIAARAMAAAAEAKRNKLVPPGFPEVKAPEVKELPPVEPPKPAETKPREEVKIEEKDEPIAPTAPEESDLSPARMKKVHNANDVLDLLKRRRDLRISNIQEKFGLSANDALDILKGLEKRGLATGKLGKWNYNAAPGEKIPGPVAPPTAEGKAAEIGPVAPPEVTEAPKAEEPVEAKKELDQISTGSKDLKLRKAFDQFKKKYPDGTPEQIGELMYYKFLNSGYSKAAYADYVRPLMGDSGPAPTSSPSVPPEAKTEIAPEVKKSEALPEKVLERLKSDSEDIEAKKAPKVEKKDTSINSPRSKRITDLMEQIAEAEEEGSTESLSVLQKNLKHELTNAKIEKSGSVKAKEIVAQMDNVSNRIDALETKQEKLALNNEEQRELDHLYREQSKLEQKRDFELKPEVEKYGDYAGGLRDLHAEAQLHGKTGKESHKFLTDRAIEEGLIEKSLKELENKPGKLKELEETLKTERMEREQEISDLEEEQLDGKLSPEKESKLKKLWKDETGEESWGEGWKNLTELLKPITKGWLQSGETVLRKEGGQKLADAVRRARTMGEIKAGDLIADYRKNIKNLTKAEAENLLKVVQGDARAMNEKVAAAARVENVRFQKIVDALGDMEVNIDPLNTDRTDRAVLSDFYTAAGKKLGEVEQLGRRTKPPAHMREGAGMSRGLPEDVHKYIEQIRRKGGDWRTTYQVMDAYFNPNRMSAMEQRLWDKMAAFQVASKLGLSVISNVTQAGNVALVTGNTTMLKAALKEARNFGKASEFSLRSGSTLSSVTHETALSAGAAPHGIAGKMMEYTGFAPVEVNNRILSTMSGVEHAVKMFNKLRKNPNSAYARRHLQKWLGLDPEQLLKQDKLTYEQAKIAGHTLADRTQFRTTPLEIPHEWGSSIWSKSATLFKNFGFNQAKFMVKDILMGEIGKGNLRPLIPLFTTVPALGYLAHNMKNLAVGKDQAKKFWQRIVDIYSAGSGAGILQDLAMSAAVSNVAGFIAGPVAGDIADLLQSTYKSGKQESPKPLLKEAVKRIPVVGRPAVGHLPYFKKAPAAGGRAWGTLNTTEKPWGVLAH